MSLTMLAPGQSLAKVIQTNQDVKTTITQETDVEKRKLLADQYIREIKAKQDTVALADAYLFLSEAFSHSKTAVHYADSIVQLTQRLKNNPVYPAEGYLQKGIQLYYLTDHEGALQNYLKADDYFDKQSNEFKQLVIRHYIGLLKNYINESEEGFLIFRENIKFFDKKEHRKRFKKQYLKSLYALAYGYIEIKMPDSALFYSKLGIEVSLKTNDKYLYPYFLFSSANADILRSKYLKALDSMLKGSVLILEKKKSLCTSYLTISEIHDSLNNRLKSIEYLYRIDSVYQKEPQVILQVEEAYQILLKKYQNDGNRDKQLEIIEKLLLVDSIINLRPKNLSRKIVEQYDTPRLLEEKERLIHALEDENDRSTTYIALSCTAGVALFFLFITYYQRDKRNKRRFEELMQTTDPKESKVIKKEYPNGLDIAEVVVEEVLHKLQKFEKDKGFLDPGVTAVKLASTLDTNSKYLTKIISYYKGQSFIYYMNTLRINWIVSQLKDNPKLRNYTLKALAQEAGFNSTDVFSKYFSKITGITPSYFIKQLDAAKK